MSKIGIFIAEFIGTFALIFVGVGAITTNHITAGAVGLTGIAFAHGLTIAVMGTATGAVSGGHLNPAVSIALASVGKLGIGDLVFYIIAQCLGAATASYLLIVIFPNDALVAVSMGVPAVHSSITAIGAMVLEAIMTFFLVFAVFGTAVDRSAPKVGALFIGLTVTLDIFIGGPMTGAAMNPARHFGPALLGGGFLNCWVYWIGPILGGSVAAILYKKFINSDL